MGLYVMSSNSDQCSASITAVLYIVDHAMTAVKCINNKQRISYIYIFCPPEHRHGEAIPELWHIDNLEALSCSSRLCVSLPLLDMP